MTEYALILGLIALVVISTLTLAGGRVSDAYCSVARGLGSSTPCHFYYADWDSTTNIGRISTGGNLENTYMAPGAQISDVAINQSHIYWMRYDVPTSYTIIGEANLDGSIVNANLISLYAKQGQGLTLDANYLYFDDTTDKTIARASLDGSGLNTSFVTTSWTPSGQIQATATDIWWADSQNSVLCHLPIAGGGGGTCINDDAQFSSCLYVSGSYVYYCDNTTHAIARENTDGSNTNSAFIPGYNSSRLISDGQALYWVDSGTGAIGRANLDGTGVNGGYLHIGLDGNGRAPAGLAMGA